MPEILLPDVTAVVSSVFIVVLTIVAVFTLVHVIPAIRQFAQARRLEHILPVFDKFVTDTVLRLAFSAEDLSRFEDTAEETGRDVRLVAAIYILDKATNSIGLKLDEEQIVSAVEAKLEQLKNDGAIPSQKTA
jgi:hypothetical protein